MELKLRKFEVDVKSLLTGETDTVEMQLSIPGDLSELIHAIFDDKFLVLSIKEIQSIVSIRIEAICPN